MSTNPKFTIFTGFYNYLDDLEKVYESIKNQTYPNWEWLVCDDFSEDPSVLEALKNLEKNDNRVRVIYPKWKKHYYWNLPVSESLGEFILVQDSDDLMYSKLLECYLYHFEKFPELSVIGATSVMRGGTVTGHSIGAKYVKYNGSSNYIEAFENEVHSISGDARCFRKSSILHRGEIVREGEYAYSMSEDIMKMLNYEECGKIVCLPRALHDYTYREGSVSGPTWQSRGVSIESIEKENQEMISQAKSRKDRTNLESIFYHYEDSFDSLYQMFYSDLGKITYRARVEYYKNVLSARNRNRISELYFDHDFWFNEKIDHPSHLIFSIKNLSDLENLSNRLSSIDKSIEEILITLEKEAQDIRSEVESAISNAGFPWWYFIEFGNLFTFRINPKSYK
jgi:glycosyltransferase involved in cell wall biosynthesis